MQVLLFVQDGKPGYALSIRLLTVHLVNLWQLLKWLLRKNYAFNFQRA